MEAENFQRADDGAHIAGGEARGSDGGERVFEDLQIGGQFRGVLVASAAFANLRERVRRDLDRQTRDEQFDELPPRF